MISLLDQAKAKHATFHLNIKVTCIASALLRTLQDIHGVLLQISSPMMILDTVIAHLMVKNIAFQTGCAEQI